MYKQVYVAWNMTTYVWSLRKEYQIGKPVTSGAMNRCILLLSVKLQRIHLADKGTKYSSLTDSDAVCFKLQFKGIRQTYHLPPIIN